MIQYYSKIKNIQQLGVLELYENNPSDKAPVFKVDYTPICSSKFRKRILAASKNNALLNDLLDFIDNLYFGAYTSGFIVFQQYIHGVDIKDFAINQIERLKNIESNKDEEYKTLFSQEPNALNFEGSLIYLLKFGEKNNFNTVHLLKEGLGVFCVALAVVALVV